MNAPIDSPIDIVKATYQAIDRADLAAVPDLFDPEWVNEDPSLPQLRGHAGARQLITLLTGAFPDFRTSVDLIIADGDRVAARLTHTGTHRGDFLGVPANGRTATVGATGLFTVRDGRLVRNHVIFDALGLLTQLGVQG